MIAFPTFFGLARSTARHLRAALLMPAFLLAGAGVALAATSTTTISVDPPMPAVGQTATITATITADGGNNVCGGLGVFFFDGAELLNPVADVGVEVVCDTPLTGTATLTTVFDTAGLHALAASYSGTGTAEPPSIDVGGSSDTHDLTVIGAQSTTVLNITPNPIPAGETVTLVATVSAPGGDVTTGLGVTFFDGPNELGTVPVIGGPLTGTATLTTSFATTGPHEIVAAFNGTDSVGASNSSGTANVGAFLDSVNLRATQILVSRLEALASGRAFVDAVQSAVYGGFDMQTGMTVDSNGVHLSYVPPVAGDVPWPDAEAPASNTQIWANLSGSGVGDWDSSDPDTISGLQINALVGASYKLSPDLLVGVVGGYEAFSYDSTTMNSTLSGDGWTLGGYAGADLGGDIKLFGALAYSGLAYDGSAGDATGSFGAWRLTASGGIAGSVEAYGLEIEPSLNMFGLWEGQDGYTDSLGTEHEAREFMTGQVSAGIKISHPLVANGVDILPYAGLYADYSLEGDSDELAELGLGGPVMGFDGGISGRVVGGVSAAFDGGANVDFGAQIGGLGSDLRTYKITGSLKLPL